MNKRYIIIGTITVLLAGLGSWWVVRHSSGSRQIGYSASGFSDVLTGTGGPGSRDDGVAVAVLSQGPALPADSEETPDAAILTEDQRWKGRLLELLRNDTYSDRELGQQLLKIVEDRQAPDWARAHAMANALNFTDDENYGADVKPLALRTDLPEVVNDVILEDLINRDPAGILSVARELAATSQHPLAGAIEEFVRDVEGSRGE